MKRRTKWLLLSACAVLALVILLVVVGRENMVGYHFEIDANSGLCRNRVTILGATLRTEVEETAFSRLAKHFRSSPGPTDWHTVSSKLYGSLGDVGRASYRYADAYGTCDSFMKVIAMYEMQGRSLSPKEVGEKIRLMLDAMQKKEFALMRSIVRDLQQGLDNRW